MNTINNTSNSTSAKSGAKYKKFTEFLNWPYQSFLTKVMLIKKDV